jgi:uncharacterized membrane protein YfcA
VVVVSVVLARYVDIRYHKGKVAYGDDPATLKHWRQHALLLVVVALGAWVGARLAARLLS